METSRVLQQNLANIFGYRDQVTWDSYADNEVGLTSLKRKIALIITNPENNSSANNNVVNARMDELRENNSSANNDVVNAKMDELREKIVAAVWNQRKYNGGELLMSPIFICHVADNLPLYDLLINKAFKSTSYTVHPLFRIRKCIKSNDSSSCCMIFVDENARVYQSWENFIMNTILPDGVVIAPAKGVYVTVADQVELDIFFTPQHFLSAKILNAADVASTVVGVGASLVVIGALAIPALAPGLVIAAASGIGCGIYSLGRATSSLFGRARHEQSISLTDNEARACWLGILGGVTGLAAGVATKGLAFWAANGEQISAILTGSVNAINASAIAANGAGVINGFVGFVVKRIDNETMSATEVLQLASSLFLFTHSVYNFQMADTIVTNARNGAISDYRSTLSRNQKRAFDKIAKETVRVNGENGRVDIIRGLKNIPDQKAYFRDVYKINKKLNENSVRPTMNGEGKLLLNNKVSTDPGTLRATLKAAGPQSAFANVGSIPESHSVSGTFNPGTNVSTTTTRLTNVISELTGVITIFNSEDLRASLIDYMENLTHNAFDALIFLVRSFVVKHGDEVQRTLNRIIPFETFLSDIFNILYGLVEDFVELDALLIRINVAEAHVLISGFYQQFRKGQVAKQVCKICNGTYFDN